eukprot:2630869-Pyramimonas_sp.AAC.1
MQTFADANKRKRRRRGTGGRAPREVSGPPLALNPPPLALNPPPLALNPPPLALNRVACADLRADVGGKTAAWCWSALGLREGNLVSASSPITGKSAWVVVWVKRVGNVLETCACHE